MNIREVSAADVDAIIKIDAEISDAAKPQYWHDALEKYHSRKEDGFFLIAEQNEQVVGFIIGEIRAWEFGSPPCGWVFVIGVKKEKRLSGIGTRMLDALCECFRQRGITRVRTMIARQDHELLAFFRSHGMLAGPYQQLEKNLD
ncbi:MAG: GNAT family N-acetyltransferase [Balneolaceae bacterium]